MRATVELVLAGMGGLAGSCGESLSMTRELETLRVYLSPRDPARGTISVIVVRNPETLEHELRVAMNTAMVVMLPLPLEREPVPRAL